MSFNIRDYVSDDHIESIGEIATGQARIIQVLTLDNSQKDKEIERLNNIINEFDKWLENINIGELDDLFIGVKLSELKKAWNDIKGSDKE